MHIIYMMHFSIYSNFTDLIPIAGRKISLICTVRSVRVAWSPSSSKRLVCLPTLTRSFMFSVRAGLQAEPKRKVQTYEEIRLSSRVIAYLITPIKCASEIALYIFNSSATRSSLELSTHWKLQLTHPDHEWLLAHKQMREQPTPLTPNRAIVSFLFRGNW